MQRIHTAQNEDLKLEKLMRNKDGELKPPFAMKNEQFYFRNRVVTI